MTEGMRVILGATLLVLFLAVVFWPKPVVRVPSGPGLEIKAVWNTTGPPTAIQMAHLPLLVESEDLASVYGGPVGTDLLVITTASCRARGIRMDAQGRWWQADGTEFPVHYPVGLKINIVDTAGVIRLPDGSIPDGTFMPLFPPRTGKK